jgi:L-asparaginase
MRSPQTPGADGPANLLAAVLTARADASRARGVLVVMNDEVHAAAHVSKVAAIGTDAFRSPGTGPAGYVWEGEVGYVGTARRRPPLGWPEPLRPARVALVEMCLGDDGTLLRLAACDCYDGYVISSFGAGHAPAQVAGTVTDLVARLPVVFATRTGAGTTLRGTYAFAGSEADLIARGALPAGWLRPRQARLLLWALLAQGADAVEIAEQFTQCGSR